MKRTFLALPITLAAEYDTLRSELQRRTHFDDITWVSNKLSHLTLRFIGNTPEDKIPHIIKGINEIAAHTAPLNLQINKLGVFGSHYAPRVLWLGLEPTPQLLQLYSEINSLLNTLNMTPQEENFVPHITLGRIKKIDNKKRFWQMFQELQPEFHQQFHIEELHFIRSRLENSGPIYSSLHIAQLK